jgi:Ca2+-binding RTX toxin-like protein
MGYSLALTAGAQAQNEGNGAGAASWTYTLTRTGGDINAVDQTYSFHIFNTDTTPSDDFTGGADGTFNWLGTAGTTTVTFTTVQDVTVEPNENPIIWFFSDNTSLGTPILRNQDVAGNVITITNDDTGLPVFSTGSTISAAENTQAITTVAASSGATAVTYAITGGDDMALFAINGTTGALTWVAGTGADFETKADANTDGHYNLKITATGGGTAASTEGTFDVVVTNVNETPTITSYGGGATAAGNPTVVENSTTAGAAGTLTATDVDSGDVLTWSIGGGADAGKFAINSSTGALSFAAGPNFEVPGSAAGTNVYTVDVKVADAGGLSDTQTLNVTVTDDAAETPLITSYGGAALQFITASENTATSTTLATVAATDRGAGTISYSLAATGDFASFTVSAAGALTFTTSPDYEAPSDVNGDNVFDVTVVATSSDGGATSNQEFLLFLQNVVEAGETSGGGSGGFTPPVVVSPPTTPTTTGNDNYAGGDEDNTTNAGAGNDTIDGGAGNDCLDGDTGNDKITGGTGADFIRGLNDADTVDGGDGADTVNGNLGEDSVLGGTGADVVYGGQGNDTVDGGEGDDPYVNGNIGDDIVHGGYGNDSVYGGQNNDTIYGDEGDDRMSGDLGNDVMFGGNGADRFALTAGGGADWVGDFRYQDGDRILLAPGTTYTTSTYQNQVLISLSDGSTIGLVGVSTFDSGFIVFGS